MRNHGAPSAIVVAGFVVAFCLFALTATSAQAQQGSAPGPPPPGNRDPFAEVRERQQREAQLRSAEMLGGAAIPDRRGVEAIVEQVKEDFRRIQILRNNLVRHLLAGKPLDYKLITDATEEINKRANRLKTHLVRETPEIEKKEQEKRVEIGDGQIKDSLVRMCQRIDSFTENPVFKVPGVVDVEQSAKAGRDLQEIIHLSGDIKRVAERLNKEHRK